MIDLIPLALILLLAGGLTVLLGCRMERAIPLAVFAVDGLLYAAGLIGALYAGYFLCIGLSLASGFVFVRALRHERGITVSRVLTPGFYFYLAAMGFSFLITIGRVLMHYDEFTHWGLIVKNLYLLNAFPGRFPSTVLFLKYPPAASLISYFFVRFSPSFSELSLYRGLHALMFALMTPAFSALRLTRKTALRCLLLAMLLGLLPMALYTANAYISIYVDCLMGLLFGYLLFELLADADKDASPLRLVSAALSAAVLALTKDAGLGLVILAYLIFLVENAAAKRTGRLRRALFGAAAPLSALAAFFSWRLHYQALGLTNGAYEKASRFSLNALFSLLSGTAGAEADSVLFGFLRMFFKPVGSSPLSPSTFVIILLFLLLGADWILRADKAERRPRIALISAMLVGFVLYALAVLEIHLFLFSTREALTFGSFHRYLHTYLLGAILCLICFKAREDVYHPAEPIVLIALCMAFLLPTELFRLNPAYPRNWRKKAPALYAKDLSSPSDRVLYVTGSADRLDFFVVHFSATPAVVDLYDGTALTKESLAPYSYVFFYSGNADFLAANARLFDGPPVEETLYRITYPDGEPRLSAVG